MRRPRIPLAFLAVASLVLAGCLGPASDLDESRVPTSDAADDALQLNLTEPVRDLRDRLQAALNGSGTVTLEVHVPGDPLVGSADPRVGVEEVEVAPAPSPLLNDTTWYEVGEERVDAPFLEAYGGHVAGDEDAPFRLVLTEDWARGIVVQDDRFHRIRVGLDGNAPVPWARMDPAAPNAELPARYEPAGETTARQEDCLRLVPPYAEPVVDVGANQDDVIWTKLVLDAGPEVWGPLGNETFPLLVAMLHEVDPIYEHELGVRFHLEGVHAHPEPGRFPAPSDDAPLAALEAYWNNRSDVDRDIVHFLSGKGYSYAQANCIGGAGHPDVAYSFTPLDWAVNYTTFHTQAFAHELGHLFSAHHHYGNHGETAMATIMIQGYTPGNRPVFSTTSKSVMRGWAASEIAG